MVDTATITKLPHRHHTRSKEYIPHPAGCVFAVPLRNYGASRMQRDSVAKAATHPKS
jgi:hypothetical protein